MHMRMLDQFNPQTKYWKITFLSNIMSLNLRSHVTLNKYSAHEWSRNCRQQSCIHLILDLWMSPIWGPFAILNLEEQLCLYVEVLI